MQTLQHYEHLAALFEYPERDYPGQAQRAHELLASRYRLAAAELDSFRRALPSEGTTFSAEALDEMQEVFTRSFDVQSITTLSVGYVVFGDDYKRGELLVNLNREHREAGIDCGSELSDHLPNVLRLMAKWQDREMVVEFVEQILRPALARMIAEFGSERMEQRNKLYKKHFKTLIASSTERGTIFRAPLVALAAVIEQDFGPAEPEQPKWANDFLHSIGQELDIEGSEGRPAPLGRML